MTTHTWHLEPRRVSWLAIAFLLIAGSSSCTSDGAGSNAATSTTARSTATECAEFGGDPIETGRRHLSFDGKDRQYQLSLPEDHDPAEPVPVILNLHGLTSNIEEQDAVSNLPTAAGARGYAVVTPEALPASLPIAGGSSSNFWNIIPLFVPPAEPGTESPATTQAIEGAGDDLGFLSAAMDDVERVLCVDTDREYVTGISNGAGMTMALICTEDDRFAAAAPVAGVNMGTVCPATKPTSLIAFHGDADPLVPIEGGDMFSYPLGLPSVTDRLGTAAALAGCDPTPTTTEPSEDSVHRVWTCPDGYGMELYTIIGGGHTWPGVTTYIDPGTTRSTPSDGSEASPFDIETIVGHQTTDIVATDLMLDFFDDHTRAAS